MKSLNEIAASTPVHERKTTDVDITDFVPHEENEKVTLTFQDPDTNVFYTAGREIEVFLSLYPEMSAELASEIGILALCHVAPDVNEEGAGPLYARICAKNMPLFLHIKNQFYKAFPHLNDLHKAAQFRKNA